MTYPFLNLFHFVLYPNHPMIQPAYSFFAMITLRYAFLLYLIFGARPTSADGEPRAEIFAPDRLHMNEEGYAIWAKAVRESLPGTE